MDVGVQMIFQSYGYPAGVTDAQVYDEEIALGVLADELGFDALWPVEHHFEDYAFCPDNTVFLAYMAARTTRIGLGTGAVIVPWNTPLRVAEKLAMLDHLCHGRLRVGLGRGLARREYEPFGIDMSTSRERFDEAAPMILDALETGFIEGDGPYYPQRRTPIRPRPTHTFADRTYCVAMSPDSVIEAAHLGARMVMFSQRPYEQLAPTIDEYRDLYKTKHRTDAPPPVTCDFVYCDTDAARAEDKAREHLVGYLTSVLQHYELMSDHFKEAKGYESYARAVDLLRDIGLEPLCESYLSVQAYGTPERIIERLAARRALIGDFDLTACFRYAGLPFDDATQSMRTFAEAVLPVIKDWGATKPRAASSTPGASSVAAPTPSGSRSG
jgi:alkanesulfonate monooxygenase SsuD/methylene tetrahydromethanopterin reductase-like flavin-dependent oxidoreductase (luciferase family)